MSQDQTLRTYQSTAVLTAPPGKVVLMLFEGAVNHLECALSGFTLDDPAQKVNTVHTHSVRSLNIVSELKWSLNRQKGGELADRLFALYSFLEERITEGNLQKRPEVLKHSAQLLSGLRDAWREMLQKHAASGAEWPSPSSAVPGGVFNVTA